VEHTEESREHQDFLNRGDGVDFSQHALGRFHQADEIFHGNRLEAQQHRLRAPWYFREY